MFSPISFHAIIYFPLLISCVNGFKNVNNSQQLIATDGVVVVPATERLQAEDYDYAEEMTVSHNCSDVTIVAADYYNLAEFYQVDFGVGVQKVSVRAYFLYTGPNSISFSAGNTHFVSVQLNYTGGSCNFSEWSAEIDVSPTGVQDLSLVLDQGYYTYLDSFVFVREEANFNATDKIEAEDYTSAGNVSLFEDCGVTDVGALLPNSVLEYDLVDFGSGVDTVTLRVYNIYPGPPLDVALHVVSSTTTPFVTVQVGQTGSARCDFYTVTTFLDTRPSGLQKLFFTFPSREGGYLHLDWFQFNHTIN